MQFIVIGHDGTDDGALERRAQARQAHLDYSGNAVPKGEQIMGVAMLNDNGNMKGSVMIVDFPDREALDKWLAKEPYVTGNVWEKIEVIPCKIAPHFLKS